MNDAWNPAEDGEQDVDQEITTDTTLEEYTQRWEDEGKDYLADIAAEFALAVLRLSYQLAGRIEEKQRRDDRDDSSTYDAVKGILMELCLETGDYWID